MGNSGRRHVYTSISARSRALAMVESNRLYRARGKMATCAREVEWDPAAECLWVDATDQQGPR